MILYSTILKESSKNTPSYTWGKKNYSNVSLLMILSVVLVPGKTKNLAQQKDHTITHVDYITYYTIHFLPSETKSFYE